MTRSPLCELRAFVQLSPHIRTLLTKSTIVIFFMELARLLPPLVFKHIIDSVTVYDPAQGISTPLVGWLLAGYFGALILSAVIDIIKMRVCAVLIHRSECDVIGSLAKKLISLDVAYHETHNSGGQMTKLYRGSRQIVEVMWHLIDVFIPIFLQTILTLIAFFLVSWQVGVSFLLFIPLYILLLYRNTRITQHYRELMHLSQEQFAGTMAQSIINVRTVKDFANESFELSKSNKALRMYSRAADIRNRIGLQAGFIEDLSVSAGRIIALAISVWLLTQGRITPGSLVFLFTLSEKAYINLQRTYRTYYLLLDSSPAIERFSAIFSQPVTVHDKPNSPLHVKEGEIQFEGVNHSYGGSPALRNVRFHIPARTVTALVGRSGAGKSTVIKLILRHFDPTSGAVFIDGKNVMDYSLFRLRSGIGIVSQDVELFNESVFSNIAYGNPHASTREVLAASRLAHAHEFITALPRGYHTLIGERGVRLSGGQKQRLAIARAILRKPKILIFDEATSSLDAESERYIHESIRRLSGKVTLIIIAHRFSTIQRADQIILLENGHVQETGTHAELVRKGGIFAHLRKLQELGEVR